jgi:hypothetical protein
MDRSELPGSRRCVGCDGLTFRNREDGLCPRCAFEAEHLIEQIELDCLDRDLALMERFDAYCRERDLGVAHAHPQDRTRFPSTPAWQAAERTAPVSPSERGGPESVDVFGRVRHLSGRPKPIDGGSFWRRRPA